MKIKPTRSEGIEELVEASGVIRMGSTSFKISLRRAGYIDMKAPKKNALLEIDAHNPYRPSRKEFEATVDDFLQRNGMYLEQRVVKSDWLRGLLVNFWKSYKIYGDLYMEKKTAEKYAPK